MGELNKSALNVRALIDMEGSERALLRLTSDRHPQTKATFNKLTRSEVLHWL
jgi:hypothetical protein